MTGLSVKFHGCIERYNLLEEPTKWIADRLNVYPTLYKIVLVVAHLFRAAMMVGFMFIPHLALWTKMALCFAGSLFYRLTVERNCAYKFALPAFAGAVAFMLALPAFINMINGVAFISVASGFLTCLSLLPLPLYWAYIVLTVDYDVDKTVGSRKPQIQSQEAVCHCAQSEKPNF
jgi:hypothetical protein